MACVECQEPGRPLAGDRNRLTRSLSKREKSKAAVAKGRPSGFFTFGKVTFLTGASRVNASNCASGFSTVWARDRVRSCVRPSCAALIMAAGRYGDALRALDHQTADSERPKPHYQRWPSARRRRPVRRGRRDLGRPCADANCHLIHAAQRPRSRRAVLRLTGASTGVGMSALSLFPATAFPCRYLLGLG